jgi:hypothetical protein
MIKVVVLVTRNDHVTVIAFESIISFTAKHFPPLKLDRDHIWNRRNERIDPDLLECITSYWQIMTFWRSVAIESIVTVFVMGRLLALGVSVTPLLRSLSWSINFPSFMECKVSWRCSTKSHHWNRCWISCKRLQPSGFVMYHQVALLEILHYARRVFFRVCYGL